MDKREEHGGRHHRIEKDMHHRRQERGTYVPYLTNLLKRRGTDIFDISVKVTICPLWAGSTRILFYFTSRYCAGHIPGELVSGPFEEFLPWHLHRCLEDRFQSITENWTQSKGSAKLHFCRVILPWIDLDNSSWVAFRARSQRLKYISKFWLQIWSSDTIYLCRRV